MTTAIRIVQALGGKKIAGGFTARCPAHEDRSPSLSIKETKEGRVLVHCHAGCPQDAVINALRGLGVWEGQATQQFPRQSWHPKRDEEREAYHEALQLWDNAKAASGTVVQDYLKARGIRLPVSDQLRFSPRIMHHPSKSHFRAMIARISDAQGFCGVQRTYLNVNEPKKADVKPNKMTKGPMRGGAVRLRDATGEHMGLAEGIETALSAMQLYAIPVWATLSANRLSKIEIPPNIKTLTIFGDSGDVGRQQAFTAQDHYEFKGLHVEVIFPAAHFEGEASDFNDALTARAS